MSIWHDIAQLDQDTDTDDLTPDMVQVECKRSGLYLYAIHRGTFRCQLYVGYCRAHAIAEFIAYVTGDEYREPRDLVTDDDGECGCW